MDAADENNKCFVISPIGTSGTDGYQRAKNVLEYVITPAAKEVGLEAVRADDLSQPGSVATQIIQQLISAKMVVADLTGLNPNVFYELAVRDSFGLPVVLIAEEGTALPFDVIQQRTIFFDSRDLGSAIPAQDRIAGALREALKDPSGGSPVKAAADLRTLRSGNPEERQVAELAEHLARLSQEVASLRRLVPPWTTISPVSYVQESTDAVHAPTSTAVHRSQIAELSDEELARLLRAHDALRLDFDRADSASLSTMAHLELRRRAAARDQ